MSHRIRSIELPLSQLRLRFLRHRLRIAHLRKLVLLLLLLLKLLLFLLLIFLLLILCSFIHGVVNQQLKSIVTVLVHFNQHLKATPSPLGARQDHFPRHLALLLPLVPVNFEVASRNTVFVEGFIGQSDGLGEAVNLTFVSIFQEELVIKREKSNTRRLGHNPEDEIRVIEYGVLSNVVTLLQRLEHQNVSLLIHDLEINFPINNEVNVLAIFFKAENLITFLIYHFLHVILNLHEEIMRIALRIKIVNLLQQFDFELDPFVIIAECVLFDFVEGIGRVGPQFYEVVLPKVSQRAIILTLHSCSSEAGKEKRNFTEEVTLLQRLWLGILLFHVIQNDHIAGTLRNEVHVIDLLLSTLRDDILFWQRKHQENMRDHELDDFILLCEYR